MIPPIALKAFCVLISIAGFVTLAHYSWGYKPRYHADVKSSMVGAAGETANRESVEYTTSAGVWQDSPAKPVHLWREQLAMREGHDAYGEIFNQYVKGK